MTKFKGSHHTPVQVTEGYYHEEPGEFLTCFGTPLDKLFGDLKGFCTLTDKICIGEHPLGIGMVWYMSDGELWMGPGRAPFFKALPLGVAAGGVLIDCGGRGPCFHTRLFFNINRTFFFLAEELLPVAVVSTWEGNSCMTSAPEDGSLTSPFFPLFLFFLLPVLKGERKPPKLDSKLSWSLINANFCSRLEMTASSMLMSTDDSPPLTKELSLISSPVC